MVHLVHKHLVEIATITSRFVTSSLLSCIQDLYYGLEIALECVFF